MKKLLLFFMSFYTLVGFSQLSEDFEAATYPPTGWITFDNGIGTTNSWDRTTLAGFPYNGSVGAAMVRGENVTDGTFAEDWMVTTQVTVPATDGQLRFFTRKAIGANYGTQYDVRISTASQNTPGDFTTLQTWDDATINSNQSAPFYEQKVIDLTAYAGQNVYIAFVMTNDAGNWWLVDNVYVDQKCLDVTTQSVTSVNDTSVDLNWDNPSGASEWEIEWGPTGFAQGSGNLITPVNTNPYTLGGLTASTSYDFYVRSVCPNENYSDWVGPFSFTTAACAIAAQCDFEFVMTDDWGDGWNGNSMTITQAGQTVANITLADGTGPESVTVPLCSGVPFEVFWNSGGFTNEVGLEIIDPNSTTIFTLPFNSGGLADTEIYSGPASCTPPTCPKPSNIVVSGLTTTSGTITWSDNTGGVAVPATEWQVVIQPAGSGYPLNGSEIVNQTVFATTYNFSGLNPATAYEVYVLAVCDASSAPDPSFYGGPEEFYTLIENDECATAIVAPVNDNTSCLNTVHGSLVGATASADANTCAGTSDDDVWFQFTAINTTHSISLNNITGSATDLVHGLYSGSCGALTQLYCSDPNSSTATGLTPGQTYYVRVYSWTSTPGQDTEFDLCIGIPPSCDNSLAFCGDAGYTYPNSTDVSSYGTIDCLFTTPNPAWFFMQVSDAGSLNFEIVQENASGGGLDVDFVCWGPFTPAEFSTMCNNLYDFPSGNTTLPNNVVDCSYSAAAIENFSIPNAQVDEIYVVLITNYSNQSGTVSFEQTGGTGSTNCDIVCSLDLGPDQILCADSFEIIASATSADAYEWYLDDVLIPGATGNTLTAVQSGTYKCIIQCDINTVEDEVEITLNPTVVPTFTNPGPLCQGVANPTLPTTSSNGVDGTWELSSTPVTDVDTSTAGTFTYTFIPDPTTFPCSPQVTMDVEILGTCTFNPIASAVNLTSCETSATGDYFNVTGGTIAPATDVFTGTPYGTYVQGSGNFVLNGGQLRSTKTVTSNVCEVYMYYRVYETSTAPPAFTSIQLNLYDTCSGGVYPIEGSACSTGEQIWENTGAAVDLTTYAAGDYTVEVYYELIGDNDSPTACDGDIVTLNNSGNNYIANFSIQDPITFASQNEECDANNASITFSGFPVGEVYAVTYNDDTVAIGPLSYTVNASGEIVISGLDAGTYDTFNFEINGCTIQELTPIVITNFSPSIVGVTNNTPICFGDDADFIVEGTPNYDVNYTINGGAVQTTTLDATGFATITVTNPAAGSVDLELTNIYNATCDVVVTNTSSVTVNPLPVATITAVNATVCVGSDAEFTITGTPNATVTISVDGGANQTIVLDGSGNYTLTVSSSTDVQVELIDVTDGTTSCSDTFSGQIANVTVVTVPVPTADITQPTCSVTTGTVEVTSPLISQINYPGDLFISEITDAQPGSLTYVEIYNGTGVDVDLSNYKIKVTTNGSTLACDLPLSGTLVNDDVVVIKLSSSADEGGVVADLSFTTCGGVNNNDRIALATIADVDVDVWGTPDGSVFTPASGIGYNYQRITTGTTLPSTTWNAADWNATDWGNPTATTGDYSDVGNYTLYAANYEYTLSDGTTSTTQTTTTFSGVASGTYTLVVYDAGSGCYSQPLDVIIDPVVFNDPVTTFSYTTPVCQGGINILPDTSAVDFVMGGTYSATPVGLVIDSATGEIDLAASTPSVYTITYSVVADPANCLNAGSSTFDVEITPGTQATFNDITLCQGDFNTTLPAMSLEGYTGTWDAANIDTSAVGMITYTFTPDAGQCAVEGYLYVDVISKTPITFTSLDACIGAIVDFPTTTDEGYVLSGSWSPSSISTATSGDVVYTFTPDDVCYDMGTFTVMTESCTIQKGISPNGDGSNDNFDLSSYNVSKLEIFNRYGRKVYNKSNYVDEWYGQANNGNDLPTGTYYYVIEFNDLPAKTGWIYINRQE